MTFSRMARSRNCINILISAQAANLVADSGKFPSNPEVYYVLGCTHLREIERCLIAGVCDVANNHCENSVAGAPAEFFSRQLVSRHFGNIRYQG